MKRTMTTLKAAILLLVITGWISPVMAQKYELTMMEQ